MPKKNETVRIAVAGTGSQGNAYLVTVGDSKILLDAGVPAAKVRKLNNNKLADIDALIVTHTHSDHSKYIDEYLKMGVRFIFCEIPIECKKFNVYPDMQSHDLPCRGYSIDFPQYGIMLHYITDTAAINVSNEYLKADRRHYWIVECNYCEEKMLYNDQHGSASIVIRNLRTRDTHLSDNQVVEYFRNKDKALADAILFVHMSLFNFNYELFKTKWTKDLPKALIAEQGEIYEMHGKFIKKSMGGSNNG